MANLKSTPIDALAPPQCVCDWPSCVCLPAERALRSMQDRPGHYMNAPQREWCLSEISSVEGYDRKDYERSDDSEIARGVLSAWTDYCRDKGLA